MSREVAHALSPREAAILRLASEGHTDASIAHQLEISEGTVGTYWGRIRTKLGPYSRPELVAVAIRSELMKEIEELEAQRDRLKNELEQMTEEERLFEEILDAADEGVIVTSLEGQIEHANPYALKVFGYNKNEIVGVSLDILIPERFREIHRCHLADFSVNPGNRRMNEHSDTVGLTKDGRELTLYIAICAVRRHSDSLFTCFIRPAA